MAATGNTTGNENVQGTAMSKRGQMFWNAYANLKGQIDPAATFDSTQELLTYIQADPRYVDYHQMFVDSQNISVDERNAKQAEALQIQQASNAQLDAIDARGAYDTDVRGAANDFFFLVEQNYPSVELPEVDASPIAPALNTNTYSNRVPLTEQFIVANYTTAYTPDIAAAVENDITTIDPDEGFDAEWAAEQFGPLAETPEEEITPHVEPIAAEVVPEPLLWTQERPIEEPEVEEPVTEASILQFQVQEPEAEVETQKDFQEYEVARGDNLWNIAKEHYGLGRGDDAAIMEAVTKISILNGLEQGTNANNLKIGQEIKLPDSPSLANWNGPDNRLDWEALDAQTAARKASMNLSGNFKSAVNNEFDTQAVAPVPAMRQETLAL